VKRLFLAVIAGVLVAAVLVACGTSDDTAAVSRQQCATDRPLPAGQSEQTLVSGGHERSYVRYVPPGYDPGLRTPVAVMFHGLGGDPDTVLKATDMIEQADKRGAILIVPRGRGKIAQWEFRSPITDPDSDLAFVRDLVKQIKREGCVDSSQVYAAGFSNGSALTLALACDASTKFAAYAAVAGPFFEQRCATAPPASIIYFHGTADTTVPFGGAQTVIGQLPAVNDTMANWAMHDRCPAAQAITKASDTVHYFAWENCRAGTSVDIYAVVGGVHGWPGGGPMSPGRTSRTKDSPVNATKVMWEFFDQHPAGGH
jgi:polyhydroxybutyrate depolymerase